MTSAAEQRLTRELGALVDANRRPPCTYGTSQADDYWFSSDAAERAYAVTLCIRCSVLAACTDYTATLKPRPRAGVFAAIDHTTTRPTRGD